MSIGKKLGIALVIFLLVLAAGYWFVTRGNTAVLAWGAVTGTDPQIPDPNEETVPTVDIAKPIGWAENEAPVTAQGLQVSRFATGLDHPRTMYTLPNGDVLVSLTRGPTEKGGGITGWIADRLMTKAGATGVSPNKVVLLRDTNGDGKADVEQVVADGLNSPSGLAWEKDTLYIANTDAVLAFPYKLGDAKVSGPGRKIMDLAGGGGHWMRNLRLSPDGTKLYIAVGSATNIADNGLKAEEGRALIWELDLASGTPRVFGAGLRNPNGLDFSPWSGELWTTVNERDMLGSDLVPDYLTNVPLGVDYGWPWVYYRNHYDTRVTYPIPEAINYVRNPEYALGPHVAALGLAFSKEGARMGPQFSNGAFIAEHGSWNRKPPSGYSVVYVPFDKLGNPQGKPVDVLTGFLAGDGKTHGRPTWVAWAKDGALLVTDDTAGIVWRVIANGAQPQGKITEIEGKHLPPRKQLNGLDASFGKDDYARIGDAP